MLDTIWLASFLAIPLECDFPISEAIFHSWPIRTPADIWNLLRMKCKDQSLIKQTLRTILHDCHWETFFYLTKNGTWFESYSPDRTYMIRFIGHEDLDIIDEWFYNFKIVYYHNLSTQTFYASFWGYNNDGLDINDEEILRTNDKSMLDEIVNISSQFHRFLAIKPEGEMSFSTAFQLFKDCSRK